MRVLEIGIVVGDILRSVAKERGKECKCSCDTKDGIDVPFIKTKNSSINPIGKVYKRFTNEKEDDLSFFAEVAIERF